MTSPKVPKFKPQLADSEIVKRVLLGEKELFEILVGRNNQSLYRVIRSYLKDDNDVQDAMQEAYFKAYDKLQQFQGDSSFSTWLIRIGINEALLQIRANKNIASLSAKRNDPQLQKLLQVPDSTQMNPEKKIIQKEIRNVIEQTIDRLPLKYRTVYVLREIEGLELGEIADCLGLSESNVKVRLHRAKSLLRDALYDLSAESDIFEFGKIKCDTLVHIVMTRIREQ